MSKNLKSTRFWVLLFLTTLVLFSDRWPHLEFDRQVLSYEEYEAPIIHLIPNSDNRFNFLVVEQYIYGTDADLIRTCLSLGRPSLNWCITPSYYYCTIHTHLSLYRVPAMIKCITSGP